MRGKKAALRDGDEYVHMRIRVKNREGLRAIGTMADTFDDVIERLIKEHNERQKQSLE